MTLTVGWVTFTIGVLALAWVARCAWRGRRRRIALTGLECERGNMKDRRRLRRLVTTGAKPEAEAVIPAEYADGWVYIKVVPRERRGRAEHPGDCYYETVVWGPTRRAAVRRGRAATPRR